MRRVAPAIPLNDMLEKQLEQQVVGSKSKPGLARMLGWSAYHTLRSQGSEPGFPDWCLVRERVLWIELKREKGVLSDAQVRWLRALRKARAEVYVVRPRHLEAIAKVLQLRLAPAHNDALYRLTIQPLNDELQTELEKRRAA